MNVTYKCEQISSLFICKAFILLKTSKLFFSNKFTLKHSYNYKEFLILSFKLGETLPDIIFNSLFRNKPLDKLKRCFTVEIRYDFGII